MRVSEIFYSLQGEGFMAGVPSAFIRLSGCPLRCKWCDTKYAWDEKKGTDYSIDEIIQAANKIQSSFIVITGGEPMINPDMSARKELEELVNSLKKNGKHITIETAGIVFMPNLACDLMSISPKLSNSTPNIPELAAIHEKSRLDLAVLSELIENYEYQLKFVVDTQDDLAQIQEIINQISSVDSSKIMLMPQAKTRNELLTKSPMVAQMCKQTGFTFCQRLQILLWDNKKGV